MGGVGREKWEAQVDGAVGNRVGGWSYSIHSSYVGEQVKCPQLCANSV